MPTLRMARSPSKRQGFTLVEMSIVIALVALFAAAVVPNLVASRDSRREREFVSGMKRLVMSARERAINGNETLHLGFSGNRLTVTHEGDSGQQGDEVAGVDLVEGANASRFQTNGQDSSSADWDLRFFPDGTADVGGAQIDVGQNTYVLNVNSRGGGSVDDQFTDLSTVKWQAGSYETR